MSRSLLFIAALLVGGCGPGWTDFSPGDDAGWGMNVFSAGAGHRIIVGGSPDTGRLTVETGGVWTAATLPADTPLLNWVHGFGPDQLTAVGRQGTVLDWNGESWARIDTPTDADLWGVWGATPDDLWAVGGDGVTPGGATLIHFDGRVWETVTPPTLTAPSVNAFFKVWGSGANDVYIVGQHGALLRWDGSALSEIVLATAEDLVSVWGTGPDEVVVVGGRSNGMAARWDGASWTVANLAPLAGLNGVWLRPGAGRFHVAGGNGTVAVIDLASLEVLEEERVGELVVHSVHGDADGRLTAVGGNLGATRPPFEGVFVERKRGGDE